MTFNTTLGGKRVKNMSKRTKIFVWKYVKNGFIWKYFPRVQFGGAT